MTLVKDSLDETLDGSGNAEPKGGSAKIIDSREELYPRLYKGEKYQNTHPKLLI